MSDVAANPGAVDAVITAPDPSSLAWDKQGGLLPAVIQHAGDGRVLMLGYMDRAAFDATLAKRRVTFFSRSRQAPWTKGETSGHWLDLASIATDCDADALLVRAWPQGPTCHRGTDGCFDDPEADGMPASPAAVATGAGAVPAGASDDTAPAATLAALDALLARREAERPAGSYTTSLFEGGIRRIAQKVGEEGVETALAAVAQDDAALLGESADLAYHLLVLLRARGLGLADLERTLAARMR